MTVKFQKDATIVILPNPNYPGLLRKGRPQVKNAAIGGRVVVTDLSDGTNLVTPRLTWKSIPKTDFDAMETFLEDTAKRSQVPFAFTDWDGTVYSTVRYWDGLEGFGRSGFNRMAGTITLREIP